MTRKPKLITINADGKQENNFKENLNNALLIIIGLIVYIAIFTAAFLLYLLWVVSSRDFKPIFWSIFDGFAPCNALFKAPTSRRWCGFLLRKKSECQECLNKA